MSTVSQAFTVTDADTDLCPAGIVSDDYIDSPSARFALAAMKPNPNSEVQQATAESKASTSMPREEALTASDTHPHLLFLKTGGGATVSQPKHHLTPQQLQMLADGTGTLEGLTDSSSQPGLTHSKPGSATTQQQGRPMGVATVLLHAQDESPQQLASLFTPRNGEAITKALHALSRADSQTEAQGLFSSGFDSVSDQQEVSIVKKQARPTAKSLQGVYLDQPHADRAGFSALKLAAAAQRLDALTEPQEPLSWLDEPAAHEDLSADFIQMPLSDSSALGSITADGQKATPRSAVLLTMVLSIATNNTEVCSSCFLHPLLAICTQTICRV